MKKKFLGLVLTIVMILSFSAVGFIGCGADVEVTLSNSSKALFVGEEHQLTLSEDSVIVADGITWSSADSKIATVSNDGVVKGIAGGKVTITGETENGSATCEVTVTEVVATGIEIANNPTVTSYYVGGTFSSSGLSVKVSYNNNSDATITEDFTVSSPDMTTAGSKTVTVTYGEFTDTFSITVLAVEVSGVTIKSNPTKTSYYTNETFASSGLVLTVSYNDGSTEDITTGFDIGSIDMTTAGTKTVTVTYGGKSATFSITVTAVTTSSIAVKTNPSNTSYYVGDTFASTGLVITATYNNGDTSDITTGFTVSSPDMSSAGSKTITVTYNEKTTTFNITVTAVSITSIAVKTNPSNTNYYVGDTFVSTGLVITATYNNGDTADKSTDFTVSSPDMTTAGTKEVTVTFDGKTAKFDITVTAVAVTSIAVTAPTTTTYDEGDTLDLSGMVVTANYNNGTSSTIASGYTTSIASGAELATTDTSVSVTYGDFTQSFDITVNEVPEISTLTISGGATFAENATTAEVTEGEDMPAITLTGDYATSGQALRGWIVNDGSTTSYVADGSFEMPDCDTTITPYVVSQYSYDTVNSTPNENESGVLDLSDSTVYTVSGSTSSANVLGQQTNVSGVSISSRYALNDSRVGTEYSFSGDEDGYFRVATVFGIKETNNTTFTYTMKNLGDTAISYTAYQINSFANTSGCPSQVVNLEAGAEMTFSLTVNFENQNVMMLYKLNEATTNANIWVSASVSTEPVPVDVTISDTSKTTTVGNSFDLTLYEDSVATTNGVTWDSDDDNVATVDGGVVTGVSVGSTTITGTTSNGSASCEVTVGEAGTSDYVLTMATAVDGNGVTFADGTSTASISSGSALPAYILTGDYANEPTVYDGETDYGSTQYSASGLILKGWIVDDGTSVSYVADGDFEMPEANTTITPYVASQISWDFEGGASANASVSGNVDFSDNNKYINSTANYTNGTTTFANSITKSAGSATRSGSYVVNGSNVGTEYTFSCDAGDYMKVSTQFSLKTTNYTSLSYKMVNTGDTAVDFTFYQANSSGSYASSTYNQVVALAAGESIEFDLENMVYDNNNLMCWYQMNDGVTSATTSTIWVSAVATVVAK